MKANQKIRQANLSKWIDLFREQSSSGLTIKDWCFQNNISQHAYYYWKRIAKESYVNSIIPEIVPVPAKAQVTPSTTVSTEHELYNLCDSSISDSISVSIGDIRIEIGSSASDELITRIIGAVRHA